jgi:hypothetical protein
MGNGMNRSKIFNAFECRRLAYSSHLLLVIVCILISVGLTGCLTTDSPLPTTGTGNSGSTALGFTGASTAINLDGTRIKVSWTGATSANVSGYTVYEYTTGALVILSTLPKTVLSFTHGGLTSGTLHSYVVRAIDGTGVSTDTNINIVAAFTYAGVTSVAATGTTTATANFPAGGASAVQVNIYGTVRGTKSLLATVSSAATSASLTGLKSGTTYIISIVALTNAGIEDQNTATGTLQTTSLSSTRYNGIINVQAFGTAPNAPTGTPTTQKAQITWAAFTSSNSSTQYALVRTGKGNTLDMTVTTACTSAITSSCLICTKTGSGAQNCTDTTTAAPPQQYDYAVTLMPSGWVEELPTGGDTPYRVTVPIPPANMVLVQQDAANYEMCQLMGKVSDPLNHQRCSYTGLGNVPYNTNPGNAALGLSASYYDFGYNLFVDRFTAGCNWTNQTNGGMCGAGATAGDCNGNGAPAGTVGVTGNVYYDWNGSSCYYRQAAGWQSVNSTSLLTTERILTYTIDPGSNSAHNPPMVSLDQNRSWDTCQSIVDTNYGAKRLLRHREFVAASAGPWVTGDPGLLSDGAIATLEAGNGHTAGTYSCNSDTHAGVAAAAFGTNELARGIAGGPDSFNIGSVGTSQCVSRFGMQDFAANVWQWVSDVLDTCNAGAHTCARAAGAGLDSGNRDMNNFNFDGVQGPGGGGANVTGWYFDTPAFGANNFSAPLGLPLVGTDSGNAILATSLSAKLHNDYFYLYTDNANGAPFARGLFVGGGWNGAGGSGRWASYWYASPSGATGSIGFRCAVPAQ